MRRKWWVLYGFLMVESCMVCGLCAMTQQKEESAVPIPTLSPPEGNTTFVGGTTWCSARPGAQQADLQNALDWACGLGATDCSEILPDGPCFEPDTLLSHASYAFNSYYQQNGNSDIACNFGGTAAITNQNPSYGSCRYLSSEPTSAATLLSRRWAILALLFLLYVPLMHFRL